ncbi:hypothetical protein K4L44_11505 [Halosquirtibacter laminarini]|uniref:Uncharacterized protein n=1 Tax=Halosquirtibacter laminarini TaxID=3374600 RepID=A0AC61NCG7_9BACT|nr:hypothetical protein K4L44_11505 [Prolixibacteraceae bacterium]
MLPKFLIADNAQVDPDKVYVLHTETPRFIVESGDEGIPSKPVIVWFDDQPESVELIGDLIAQADAFLEAELDYQEELLDEEED